MYKRVLQSNYVVCGQTGDFGSTQHHENRTALLKEIRRGIAFATWWLRKFVLRTQLPSTRRLRMRLAQSGSVDIIDLERYLRFNIEYRFRDAASYQLAQCEILHGDLYDIVMSYL